MGSIGCARGARAGHGASALARRNFDPFCTSPWSRPSVARPKRSARVQDRQKPASPAKAARPNSVREMDLVTPANWRRLRAIPKVPRGLDPKTATWRYARQRGTTNLWSTGGKLLPARSEGATTPLEVIATLLTMLGTIATNLTAGADQRIVATQVARNSRDIAKLKGAARGVVSSRRVELERCPFVVHAATKQSHVKTTRESRVHPHDEFFVGSSTN